MTTRLEHFGRAAGTIEKAALIIGAGAVAMLTLQPTAAPVSDPNFGVAPATQRALESQIAQALDLNHCQPVAAWKLAHPKQIPARMVQDAANRVTVVTWTYPAKPGMTVDGLCSK